MRLMAIILVSGQQSSSSMLPRYIPGPDLDAIRVHNTLTLYAYFLMTENSPKLKAEHRREYKKFGEFKTQL